MAGGPYDHGVENSLARRLARTRGRRGNPGQAMLEYTMILCLIGVILVSLLQQIGAGVAQVFCDVSDGLVKAGPIEGWGANFFGQMANGSIATAAAPNSAPAAKSICGLQVASSEIGNVAVSNTGEVYMWGGSYTSAVMPYKVPGLTNVSQTVANWGAYAALKGDGTVWTWGQNGYGQLGNGTVDTEPAYPAPAIYNPTPVQATFPVGTQITQIASGQFNFLALDRSGNVWSWGGNTSYALGPAAGAAYTTVPGIVTAGTLGGPDGKGCPTATAGSALPPVRQIAASGNSVAVLLRNGTVETWGDNTKGQLGNNSTEGAPLPAAGPVPPVPTQQCTYFPYSPIAVQVGSNAACGSGVISSIVSISAGYNYYLALDNTGKVWSWGENTEFKWWDPHTSAYDPFGSGGEMGQGNNTSDALCPVHPQVSASGGDLTHVTQISAGAFTAYALLSDNSVVSWGSDFYQVEVGVSDTPPTGLTASTTSLSGYYAGYPLTVQGLKGKYIQSIFGGWWDCFAVTAPT